MKKTRLAIILAAFCIILSFFSNIYAAETPHFTIDDTNLVDYSTTNSNGDVVITAQANYNDVKTGVITFVPKNTDVYNFNVEGIDRGAGEDLFYILHDSEGKYVRLAAYYDEKTGEYITFTDKNDSKQTNVDVLLIAGKTYTLSLPKGRGGPEFIVESFVDASRPLQNYKITIKRNTSEHNVVSKVFQGSISSGKVTTVNNVSDADSEVPVDPYKMPEGVEAEFDDYDLGDGLKDTADTVAEYTINTLEEVISEMLLALGDFLVSIMNQIMGEEITITKLVYNQIDAVNPNFFDDSLIATGITANIKNVISDWYNVFKMIAIAIYLMVLLVIGLNILLSSTGDGISKAKELFTQWLKGIASLILIPYLIKYAFMLNEVLVEMLMETTDIPTYSIGSGFSAAGDWSLEEVEFRSPEYVSKYTGSVAFGSDEASESYMKKIETYEQNLDLMRIMRAYAGVTKKMIYVVIWYILIGQLILFIVQYYKRYFTIAFLIAMFPLVCIFHSISLAQGSAKGEMGSWVKELLTNIFIQFVHAIVYTVITGICVSVVKEDMQSSAALNWIIIILAINFVSEGEKLLRKIIGAMGSTAEGAGQTGKGIKATYNKAKAGLKKASGSDE